MREFSVSIFKNVSRGLRADDRIGRNTAYSTLCKNIRPIVIDKQPGLSVYSPPSDPFASGYLTSMGISISHPFPQIFKGREVTLLLDSSKIYQVAEGSDWTLTELDTKDAYDVGVDKEIVSGESWHFADMGTSFALFNGSCVVFKTNRISMFGGLSDVLVADDITINTGCSDRGRLVLGGFNPSDFWNERWESFLRRAFDSGLDFVFPASPGANFVWWSQIGDGAFFLFYPMDYILGNIKNNGEEIYSEDQNILNEILVRNEMGFMPMHWQGAVRRVLPLGNGFMVYGDNGVSYLKKAGNTFGLVDMLAHGIASRSSVGGTNSEHVFIDEAGWLWKVKADEAPRRLGFREFLIGMLDNNITISYDTIEEDYYISDGERCFVLTRDEELFETTFLTTSLAISGGGTVGVFDRPNDNEKEYAILESDVLDFGLRSIKTIERIVVSATNTENISVRVKWRYKSSDDWSETLWYPTNYEGIAYLPVKGLEFKIGVRCIDYTKVDVDDIIIHFKTDDKRIVRGTYALENVARTGV